MAVGEAFDAVVAAAARGDRDAVEVLYRDTVPIVRGYFLAQRAPDVDDLTSEVYVSMMTSLPRFRGDEARFRSWLLTIAHRRLMDVYRLHTRRPEDPVPHGDPATDLRSDVDSSEAALARLRASGVLDAVDTLTADQRNVLLLRTVADLPVSDIAAVLGKPETAVKALLRRATAALQRRLEEADPVGDDATPADDGPAAPVDVAAPTGTGAETTAGPAATSRSDRDGRPAAGAHGAGVGCAGSVPTG